MFCANCGQAIEGNPKFCRSCGTPSGAATNAGNEAPPEEVPVAASKSRFPKWLPLLLGFVALLLVAKMCAPKQPDQPHIDEAGKVALGQKDAAQAARAGDNVGSQASSLEAALADMANQINQRAPMRVDSKTVVTGAAATSRTLRMILNIDHPYPREQVLAMIESNMPSYVRSNYCSQPSQLKLLKDGAMILLEFRNRDGKEHYATVPVTFNQCG